MRKVSGRKYGGLILAGAAAVAMAGCASKPKQLPPPPGGPGGGGYNDGRVTPGSAEDFRRSVASDTIHFAYDQFDIDGRSRQILDSQAQWLAQYPNVRITIEGHCDERGTREYNLALGERRANSAKNYLATRGVDPARVSTISYGKERPIATGSDEGSYAANRRAVTIVLN